MINKEKTKETLEQAKAYLKQGFSVIPVGWGEGGKRPYLASWLKYQDELPTEELLERWWKFFPAAQIGIITGKISNLAVVDIDVDKETGKIGDFSYLPETRMAKSGSGGRHFYYRYVDGLNNKIRARELTDIKGNGGYVIAPNSELTGGKKYEWLNSLDFAPFPVNLFPITAEVQANSFIEKPTSEAIKNLAEGLKEGRRNQTLTEAAGSILNRFPPKEWEVKAWPLLVSLNLNSNPPLPEHELRTIFNSIAKRAIHDKRQESVDDKLEFVSWHTLTDVLMMADKELKETDPDSIVSFGYPWLDNMMTGFFPGELLVLGGESGSGKTVFGTNIIYKSARSGVKSCIFALEDRLVDYGIKALYFEIGKIRRNKLGDGDNEVYNYPWNDYRKNTIKDPKFEEYKKLAIENLKNDDIVFAKVDRQLDIDMLEKLVEEKISQGFKLFLIDHLHYFDLLKGDSSKADYIESVMIRIKQLQNRTGARVILIVHYKKLDGKKPTMDSFKDSISIVQNANYVLNLWRDRSPGADHFKTFLFCPKSRNPNGEFTLKLTFNPATNDYDLGGTTFGSVTEHSQEVIQLMDDEAQGKGTLDFKV